MSQSQGTNRITREQFDAVLFDLDGVLTATAKVEGDIVHKTIAIESGAQFEGTVQRQEDPLGDSSNRPAAAPAPDRPKTEARNAPPLTGEAAAG